MTSREDDQSGTLFVVATPLGNLEDTSARAVRTLKTVDLIACEDTRHTRKLLNHFQISSRTLSYHDHNAAERSGELVERLRQGQNVALVTDAGTPAVSDPGFRLVSQCHRNRLRVVPIPGPTAVAAALSVCGLPTDTFLFVGFLPKKAGPRKSRLSALQDLETTLIFFLPPHQIVHQLADIEEVLGDRPAFLAREMTKLHESFVSGSLAEIRSACQGATVKGECTLIVSGSEDRSSSDKPAADVAAYVAGLESLRGLTRKEAIRQAAVDLGQAKNAVYRVVLEDR